MQPLTDRLCLRCGMCCNGVLFADVRPEKGDASPLFIGKRRVPQPCPAFEAGECTCAIYQDRPARCRKFECRQLLAAQAGKITAVQALKKIRTAKKLARQVEKHLWALGFIDPGQSLRHRFNACQRAAERGELADVGRIGELQLAMHLLMLFLAEEFY